MLNKTLAMLKDIKPGTYLPDDVVCYDQAEIDALGVVLRRLVYAPSQIRRVLQNDYGTTITRSDFYSEIPTISDVEKSFMTPSLLTLDGIFPEHDVMVENLQQLMEVSEEFNPPLKATQPGEFSWEGGPFSYSDAMAYYGMIRTIKPKTVVEIGSGWSTLVARMACAKNGMGRIVCIEPYPNSFLLNMGNIELIKRRAQDMETSFFDNILQSNDILFIDSTHTVKHDSDCLHIYLRILPSVRKNIFVHVHDIDLPQTLSLTDMRDSQIFWNEQYLLYAYMLMNPRTRTIYGSKYHWLRNKGMLEQFMRGRYHAGGASFWFEQLAP